MTHPQIAFSYGSTKFRTVPNVVYVPGGYFNIDEDHSQ